ncbi:uncharacterized protein LOC119647593 [Hermetia illucens]|uniref:uncharacterized protein LOC119647593 n=1 Tax=Hermetia illucens TaxID=343691 RepID=UPI0018CC0E48|nr:uncharacterized protein LOC119647593 [Hermetia illucens]
MSFPGIPNIDPKSIRRNALSVRQWSILLGVTPSELVNMSEHELEHSLSLISNKIPQHEDTLYPEKILRGTPVTLKHISGDLNFDQDRDHRQNAKRLISNYEGGSVFEEPTVREHLDSILPGKSEFYTEFGRNHEHFLKRNITRDQSQVKDLLSEDFYRDSSDEKINVTDILEVLMSLPWVRIYVENWLKNRQDKKSGFHYWSHYVQPAVQNKQASWQDQMQSPELWSYLPKSPFLDIPPSPASIIRDCRGHSIRDYVNEFGRKIQPGFYKERTSAGFGLYSKDISHSRRDYCSLRLPMKRCTCRTPSLRV